MTTFFLTRHGETEWNKVHRIQGGGSDVPLSAEGHRQALALAFRLGSVDIEAIYSSPLTRSLETARVIAWPHGLEVRIDPRFREISAGKLEGVTNSELGMNLATYLSRYADGKLMQPPGGESLLELKERVWPALVELTGAHPEGQVVIASHYFVTLVVVCTVLGMPLEYLDRLRLGTASITVVRMSRESAFLEVLNDRGHLAGVVKGF